MSGAEQHDKRGSLATDLPPLRPDEAERRARAEAGQAVVASITDPGLVLWAIAEKRLVHADRKPWKNPLTSPGDGTPAECGAWFIEHYLPFRRHLAGLARKLPGKVLFFERIQTGGHAEPLAEAVNVGSSPALRARGERTG